MQPEDDAGAVNRTASVARRLVVAGDAVASFNPIYGQGMTSAALQAEALGRRLERIGNTARLPHAVAKAAAAVVANLWRIATGADFIHPRTRGAKAAGTDVFDRHLAKVIAAADDPAVNLALSRVQQMLAPPPVLFTPAIMRRALVSSRRHRRDFRTAGGAGQVHHARTCDAAWRTATVRTASSLRRGCPWTQVEVPCSVRPCGELADTREELVGGEARPHPVGRQCGSGRGCVDAGRCVCWWAWKRLSVWVRIWGSKMA